MISLVAYSEVDGEKRLSTFFFSFSLDGLKIEYFKSHINYRYSEGLVTGLFYFVYN